jgi:hypothetical protein
MFHSEKGIIKMNINERIIKLGIANNISNGDMRNERIFYIARLYSHTDKRLCWKILTRPFLDEHDAQLHLNLDYYQDLETKILKDDFFVVEIKKNYDLFWTEKNEIL